MRLESSTVQAPLMGAAAAGNNLPRQIAKAEADPECKNKDFHTDPSARTEKWRLSINNSASPVPYEKDPGTTGRGLFY
jgi:hypothetical protein